MSTYKLTYFNLTGLGEPIRFLLHYGGVKFEDHRIEHEDWPKYKADFPLGQLPVLEIDGKQYCQSAAISRYLGRKFNIAGSNELEALEIDAVVDTLTDIRTVMTKYHFAADEQQKAKLKTETFEKVAFYLDKLEQRVADNGGWFVGGKLSWADITFAAYKGLLSMILGKSVTEGYPNLQNVVDKVTALPKIKKYLEIRPETKF